MIVKIFDYKEINNKIWCLCKGNLLEYLSELKNDFYNFTVQRKIVRNQYLDMLYQTIKCGEPMPIITFTYKGEININSQMGKGVYVDLNNIEILDGLQRSFRLWTYLYIANKYQEKPLDYRAFAKMLKQENELFFDTGVLTSRLLKNLIESQEIQHIVNIYKDYDFYFVIWSGLDDKELIRKMLVLNAGQKSVSKTHQFELLFLHFYERLVTVKDLGINLFREKDLDAGKIRRGDRKIGEYMFSSIIISLQSYVEGRPVRVSTDKLIDNEFEENYNKDPQLDMIFSESFIVYFLSEIKKIDNAITEKEGIIGKEWFSKDTSISGIWGGIGKFVQVSQCENSDDIKEQTEVAVNILLNGIFNHGYELPTFNKEYNLLSSRSVNIGYFIRTAIMNYTYELLNGKFPNWTFIFKNEIDLL